MPALAFLTLFVAAFVNAALPGPCVLLTMSRTARAGVRAGLTVTGGILAGDVVVVAVAIGSTLGAIAVAPGALPAMKWLGVAALLALAAQSLRSATRPAGSGPAPAGGRDWLAGMAVGLSSPYNLIFYLALFPQIVPSHAVTAGTALLIAATALAAILAAQVGVVMAAAAARRLAGRPGRWVDVATAGLLAMLAAMAATLAPVADAPAVLTEVSER